MMTLRKYLERKQPTIPFNKVPGFWKLLGRKKTESRLERGEKSKE